MTKRILALIGFSVAAGGFLGGMTAVVTVPFMAAAGALFGAAAGFIISPLVAACLARKDPWVSLPIVFVATSLVTVLAMVTRLPMYGMVLAVLTMTATCIAAWLVLPNVAFSSNDEQNRCTACGYALTGLLDARCPECGRPFDPAWLDRPSNPQKE